MTIHYEFDTLKKPEGDEIEWSDSEKMTVMLGIFGRGTAMFSDNETDSIPPLILKKLELGNYESICNVGGRMGCSLRKPITQSTVRFMRQFGYVPREVDESIYNKSSRLEETVPVEA